MRFINKFQNSGQFNVPNNVIVPSYNSNTEINLNDLSHINDYLQESNARFKRRNLWKDWGQGTRKFTGWQDFNDRMNIAEQQYKLLLDKGWNPVDSAGVVGNTLYESIWNPEKIGGYKNHAKGLLQLLGYERDNYESQYGDNYSVENQMQYATDFKNDKNSSFARWYRTDDRSTPEKSAISWFRRFERATDTQKERENRGSAARVLHNYFNY